jgi:predicted RNA polymerase sigma factor
VVALNHAIATAMVDGPNAGLALLAPLDNDARLRGSHRLDAVRAHLLDRAGDRAAAVELYRSAASKTSSVPERNYLLMKAAAR